MKNPERLERLTKFVRARTAAGALRLHPRDAYVRASAGGLRAVCVSPDAPLCEFRKSTVKTVGKALEHVVEATGPLVSETAKSKRERSLQAHLIREALLHGGDLRPVLGSGVPFDRLLFALDEVPLHKGSSTAPLVRCDLLAVGITGSSLEPVLIELKWGRTLKRLCEQLDDYADLVEKYRAEFETLLGEAIGRSGAVSASRLHQMIVWPKPDSLGKPGSAQGAASTRKQLADAGITAIQFDDSNGYVFEPEWTSAKPARPRVKITENRACSAAPTGRS